ncbi:MFS transporter [Aeromicrobium sp. UC242_57]|uniref:MFS transporter n=1 Tax=Aeromicrobium sp. UC242_57 TaxID=3374624 RepID=UPI0037A7EAFB
MWPGEGQPERDRARTGRLPVRRAGRRGGADGVLLHEQPGRGLLPATRAAGRRQYKHTWVMSLLYIGTFGSFIGYSAAMPLLIKINFFNQPVPSIPGIGINFAFYGFLGALVGSLTRPFGGWLADRFGGARVTLFAFVGMIVGTGLVMLSLAQPSPCRSRLAPWSPPRSRTPRRSAPQSTTTRRSFRGSSVPSWSCSPQRGSATARPTG